MKDFLQQIDAAVLFLILSLFWNYGYFNLKQ